MFLSLQAMPVGAWELSLARRVGAIWCGVALIGTLLVVRVGGRSAYHVRRISLTTGGCNILSFNTPSIEFTARNTTIMGMSHQETAARALTSAVPYCCVQCSMHPHRAQALSSVSSPVH